MAFIAVLGVVLNYCQYRDLRKAQKLHLDPIITCIMEKAPGPTKTPDLSVKFTLFNEGQVSAKNISVDHYEMRFFHNIKRIRLAGRGTSFKWSVPYSPPGKDWMYLNELKPKQAVSEVTWAGVNEHKDIKITQILYFKLQYLHDSYARQYNDECLFFIDSDKIYSNTEFRENNIYPTIRSEIDRWLSGGRLGSFGIMDHRD